MSEYQKRVQEARKKFLNLNFEQERELYNIYKDAGNNLINEILQMLDSRTKNHKIETYKIINDYKSELYNNLSKTIENNIQKSSDIQKEVQLSFVDIISPNKVTNEALKRTITKISSDAVKQLIAGGYYEDGKTLSKRIWNLTGDNGNKVDAIIKDNISKGANVKELAKELDKYVNPKNRITPKTFADGIGGDNISYQARRLARTSITHAQTETMIQNAKKNPFSKGLKWNLSASHFTRMHGKKDICDDYDGRTFKPEELPLQHPNCLCYFTEVLEDMNKCIETMKDWSNGKKNKAIDDWVKSGDDNTSVKVTTPDSIQTKMNLDNSKAEKLESDINAGAVNNSNETDRIQEYKPPLAKRHDINAIGKKSVPKEDNTIILPSIDYHEDIEDIKKGLYNKINDTFEVNERIYGYHNERFYPIKGEGFVTLDRNEYKILIKMKTERNNPKLKEILLKMGATKEVIEKISNILKAGDNNGQ